jgi:hypothetical protein
MAKTLNALTVKELRERAKAQNVAKYYAMNKSQLITALAGDQMVMEVVAEIETNNFAPKYDSSAVMNRMKNPSTPPTANQMNYIATLERNYDFKINNIECRTKESTSKYISSITTQIESDELKKRPSEVVSKSLESVKPVRLASKAQLDYITRLEKETGTINKRVVSSMDIANEIINELLKVKRAMPKQPTVQREVAVTAPEQSIEEKFIELGQKVKTDSNWKNAVVSFFKRFV